ncbi:hypothetical protein PFISCL1PPCAC_9556, partial [Pristionchus fissidentatus]
SPFCRATVSPLPYLTAISTDAIPLSFTVTPIALAVIMSTRLAEKPPCRVPLVLTCSASIVSSQMSFSVEAKSGRTLLATRLKLSMVLRCSNSAMARASSASCSFALRGHEVVASSMFAVD